MCTKHFQELMKKILKRAKTSQVFQTKLRKQTIWTKQHFSKALKPHEEIYFYYLTYDFKLLNIKEKINT